jgi:ATP-dependent helicase/nuclease subunit A
LPSIEPEKREQAARLWLARPLHALDEARQTEILKETLAVINDPEFAAIFGPGSLAEVPVSGVFDGRVMSGQIDRLLIGEKEILIIDYKTNRPSPRDIKEVPALYIRQMAHYRRAMQDMHPGRDVKCALLWTEGPHLMVLPPEFM